MEERSCKGLCYLCVEKYTSNSKCKDSQVIALMVDNVEEVFEDTLDGEILGETFGIVNTIEGREGTSTVKLSGHTKKQQGIILVNMGSTHNVVNSSVAKRLGLKLQE